ncbi:hypothetical protein Goklo_001155 [Gossypium klotzschianum]|uniref:SWIM-type domain-containing protein n=1 Tax=Gossypium klotzschianum TaxID=34286 RepID=A0A7J8W026_9ROSI|nr:hypothetical protein [Gossypium klotzschianum]
MRPTVVHDNVHGGIHDDDERRKSGGEEVQRPHGVVNSGGRFGRGKGNEKRLKDREVARNGTTYTFEVMIDERSSKVRMIHFHIATMEIHCTCKKFDFRGYLCSHALRILITKIADVAEHKGDDLLFSTYNLVEGGVIVFEARLVVEGYSQVERVDVFSPVLDITGPYCIIQL